VRGAAVWALAALSPEAFAREREGRAAAEDDLSVREEWAAILSPDRREAADREGEGRERAALAGDPSPAVQP
jgi:hypothetical protein